MNTWDYSRETKDNLSSYKKGIICGNLGNYGEAIQCLMRAIKEEPENNTKIWSLIAEYCNKMGLYREVAVCLKNAGKRILPCNTR